MPTSFSHPTPHHLVPLILRYEVEEHPLYDSSSDDDSPPNPSSHASGPSAPAAAHPTAAAGSISRKTNRLNLSAASKSAQLGGRGQLKKLPGSSGTTSSVSKRWQAERAVKAAAALTRERVQRKAKAEARKREAGGGNTGGDPGVREGVEKDVGNAAGGLKSGKVNGVRKWKEAADRVVKRKKLAMRDEGFVGKALTVEQVEGVIGDVAARCGVLKAMVCPFTNGVKCLILIVTSCFSIFILSFDWATRMHGLTA